MLTLAINCVYTEHMMWNPRQDDNLEKKNRKRAGITKEPAFLKASFKKLRSQNYLLSYFFTKKIFVKV